MLGILLKSFMYKEVIYLFQIRVIWNTIQIKNCLIVEWLIIFYKLKKMNENIC